MYWSAGVFAIAIGVGLVAGARTLAAEAPIVPDLELEALKEAVRWPSADVTAVMSLAGRLMAGRRDADGLAYFRERAASEPSRGIFLALEGVFQARQAGSVSLFRRVAWVNDAVAKLDRAVALEPGLPRYLRGIVLAGLPERFGKAQAAVDDLDARQQATIPRRSAARRLLRSGPGVHDPRSRGASEGGADAVGRVTAGRHSARAHRRLLRFGAGRISLPAAATRRARARRSCRARLRFRRHRLRLDGRRDRRD
jgi:hypothetical protein